MGNRTGLVLFTCCVFLMTPRFVEACKWCKHGHRQVRPLAPAPRGVAGEFDTPVGREVIAYRYQEMVPAPRYRLEYVPLEEAHRPERRPEHAVRCTESAESLMHDFMRAAVQRVLANALTGLQPHPPATTPAPAVPSLTSLEDRVSKLERAVFKSTAPDADGAIDPNRVHGSPGQMQSTPQQPATTTDAPLARQAFSLDDRLAAAGRNVKKLREATLELEMVRTLALEENLESQRVLNEHLQKLQDLQAELGKIQLGIEE